MYYWNCTVECEEAKPCGSVRCRLNILCVQDQTRFSYSKLFAPWSLYTVYMFVLLCVCGFTVRDRKFPVLGMVSTVMLVAYSGVCITGRTRIHIYVDVNNPPPLHPPTLLLCFLPSFYVC